MYHRIRVVTSGCSIILGAAPDNTSRLGSGGRPSEQSHFSPTDQIPAEREFLIRFGAQENDAKPAERAEEEGDGSGESWNAREWISAEIEMNSEVDDDHHLSHRASRKRLLLLLELIFMRKRLLPVDDKRVLLTFRKIHRAHEHSFELAVLCGMADGRERQRDGRSGRSDKGRSAGEKDTRTKYIA